MYLTFFAGFDIVASEHKKGGAGAERTKYGPVRAGCRTDECVRLDRRPGGRYGIYHADLCRIYDPIFTGRQMGNCRHCSISDPGRGGTSGIHRIPGRSGNHPGRNRRLSYGIFVLRPSLLVDRSADWQ